MKGLLLKDFYMTTKYCRIYFIMIPLFWVLMSLSGQSFFAVYPALLFCTLPITLQNYDEKENWISYSHTLPYSTKQLVSEKYILNLITILFNLIIILIGWLLQSVLAPDADAEPLGTVLLFTSAIGIIPTIFVLPVIFKFGTEKAMIAYIAMGGGIGGLVGVMTGIFGTASEEGMALPEMPIHPALLTVLALIVLAVLYWISWNMSVKFYSKREFN